MKNLISIEDVFDFSVQKKELTKIIFKGKEIRVSHMGLLDGSYCLKGINDNKWYLYYYNSLEMIYELVEKEFASYDDIEEYVSEKEVEAEKEHEVYEKWQENQDWAKFENEANEIRRLREEELLAEMEEEFQENYFAEGIYDFDPEMDLF